jgi:hypothetical protein
MLVSRCKVAIAIAECILSKLRLQTQAIHGLDDVGAQLVGVSATTRLKSQSLKMSITNEKEKANHKQY